MIMIALLLIFLAVTFYVFAFPMVLSVLAHASREPSSSSGTDNLPQDPAQWPLVSVLVPICGQADTLTAKLINLTATTYPLHRLEVLLVLDGPVTGLREAFSIYRAEAKGPLPLQTVQCDRVGKNKALTQGARQSSGDILVFTDVDALLDPDAIMHLVTAILPEDIGGGCGCHRIRTSKGGQSIYWDLEAKIKSAEMRLLGKVTASYGTLMAVKRRRFEAIPPGVTDDHFLALSVVAQGARFIYTDQAVADLEKPSRNPVDEIRRRRRIVCQSLFCLSLWRNLLHPGRWGWFAVCLWSHKVLRRLAPLFFIFIFFSSLVLGLQGSLTGRIIFFTMTAGIGICAAALGVLMVFKRLHRLLRPPAYFLAGNLGMLIGLIDFMRGRRVIMW
jgi:cellulose synthase/poly-beta-1,6-N-acetylglucosamine synthase-like glycosyltransferase